jgi:hypothetical protein
MGASNWGDLVQRPGLAAGDAMALVTFAAVGRAMHGEAPLSLDTVVTAAPFLAAWLATSPLMGMFTFQATRNQGEGIKSLVPAWIVAMPLAIGLRALVKGEAPPTPFVIVSLVTTLVFLELWRAVYIGVNGGEKRLGDRKSGGIFDIFRMVTTLINRW